MVQFSLMSVRLALTFLQRPSSVGAEVAAKPDGLLYQLALAFLFSSVLGYVMGGS